jgi:BASS family bile acid:Na+ symporter
MMPLTMLIGVLFYPLLSEFAFLTPYLIFVMLFFTYCTISLKEMHFTKWHFWLVCIQLVGAPGFYFLAANFDVTIAQAGLICLLAPTATSAVVITGMLKGNTASLTTYSLISNLSVVLMAPLLFSFLGSQHSLPFWEAFLLIGQRVFLLLLGPLLLAQILRRFFRPIVGAIRKHSIISFYLWVVALAIVTANTVKFVLMQGDGDYWIGIGIALLSLLVCLGQFFVGKKIGNRYGDKIAAGQGLGQKNTILAIWLAQTYLDPLASIGPGAYILWQNVVNSWQVWRIRKDI